MTLQYNKDYEKYASNYMHYNNSIFISSNSDKINIINPDLTSRDANPIFKLFERLFNPQDKYTPYSKEEFINYIK